MTPGLYNIQGITIVNMTLKLKYWPLDPSTHKVYDKIVNKDVLLQSNETRQKKGWKSVELDKN